VSDGPQAATARMGSKIQQFFMAMTFQEFQIKGQNV
jgi:hypothetical protein